MSDTTLQWYYSKTTNGFYNNDVFTVDMMPPDVVQITQGQYDNLMNGHALGQEISADANGNPITAKRVLTPKEQALLSIQELENTITIRRMREAAMGIDGGWLSKVNDQITVFRTQLDSLGS